jgi:hypothetical protein
MLLLIAFFVSVLVYVSSICTVIPCSGECFLSLILRFDRGVANQLCVMYFSTIICTPYCMLFRHGLEVPPMVLVLFLNCKAKQLSDSFNNQAVILIELVKF